MSLPEHWESSQLKHGRGSELLYAALPMQRTESFCSSVDARSKSSAGTSGEPKLATECMQVCHPLLRYEMVDQEGDDGRVIRELDVYLCSGNLPEATKVHTHLI